MKNLLIILLSFLTQFCESQNENSYKVIAVKDGDSIELLDIHSKTTFVVRLAEIDCPEFSQAFGRKAKEFTSDAVFGKMVKIKIIDTDRYGRKIARVSYDGKDLSEELIKNGLAWVYTQYATDKNLKKLEIVARNNKVGLWLDNNPVAPWKWRRK